MEMSLTHIAKPLPCLFNKQILFPNKRSEKIACAKALKSSFPRNATLSSSWDVSDFSSVTPAWLSRFEELDTTNMLLRQRIIFLGSQALGLAIVFVLLEFFSFTLKARSLLGLVEEGEIKKVK